jgi:hypothetical protein
MSVSNVFLVHINLSSLILHCPLPLTSMYSILFSASLSPILCQRSLVTSLISLSHSLNKRIDRETDTHETAGAFLPRITRQQKMNEERKRENKRNMLAKKEIVSHSMTQQSTRVTDEGKSERPLLEGKESKKICVTDISRKNLYDTIEYAQRFIQKEARVRIKPLKKKN